MDCTEKALKPGLGHFDGVISKFVYETVPFWNSLNASPNTLTTFSLMCSVACIYYIHKRDAGKSILFLLLRMYFDYADGISARRYDKITDFGDWYDHVVDMFAFSIPLLIVLYKTKHRWKYIVPVAFFMIGTIINLSCIENEYEQKTGKRGNSLNIIKNSCFMPETFKWIDNSVLYMVIIIVIINLCKHEKKRKSLF